MNRSLKEFIFIIFIIAFNIWVFTLDKTDQSVFWISYSFIIFASIQFAISNFFAVGDKKNEIFFELRLKNISGIYLIVEIIIGTIFITIPSANLVIAFILQLIFFIAFLFIYLPVIIGQSLLIKSTKSISKKVQFMKELEAQVKNISLKTDHIEIKNRLSKFAEMIEYSDPMSDDRLAYLEKKLMKLVDQLKDKINKKDYKVNRIIDDAIRVLQERNNKCKAMK